MLKLVIADDEGKTTVVPLVRDELTIGRREGNTIRLTERNISRRHAKMVRDGEKVLVEDLQSYNGVVVNGERIEGKREIAIGDRVVIGDYTLALESDVTVAPPPPAASADLTPPARLVMLTAPAPGAEFKLTKSGMRIGRLETLDVWVNHRSISREHAEVRLEGDDVRIVDLDSANGVRVNAEDVREAVLRPGDVLELGQVQFRYVGVGDAFTVDLDRTQRTVSHREGRPGSRAPAMVAVIIVVIAVVAGGLIAISSGDREEGEEPTPVVADDSITVPDEELDAPAPAANPADDAARSCQVAVGQGRWEEAIAAAERARALGTSAIADACLEEAQRGAASAEIFERGRAALAEEDFDAAYFAFEELSPDSPLRGTPEVVRARDEFIERRSVLARETVGSDPQLALQHIEVVLAVPGLTPTRRRELDRLRARAEHAIATSGSRRRPNGPTGGPRTRPGGPGSAVTPPTTTAVTEPPATSAPATSSLDQARECLRRGDNQCVVRVLENDARSAAALALLIETYRTLGDTGAAQRHMRTFVQRYPDDRRAERYGQLLGGP